MFVLCLIPPWHGVCRAGAFRTASLCFLVLELVVVGEPGGGKKAGEAQLVSR